MTNYRRLKVAAAYYFFTVVTHNRRAFLCDANARECLKTAWGVVRQGRPFDVVAVCLLPEHLHCVWKLPEGDDDFSLAVGVDQKEVHAGVFETWRD